MQAKKRLVAIFILFLTLCLPLAGPVFSRADGPPPQPPERILDEMRTVYLGNLARRDNDVPPLRWNVQMTEAARWFAWDSVESRPLGFCGHTDTLGRGPWDRAVDFGYLGFCSAENAFCGYVTPEQAIAGWMDSPGHRENLLNPSHQEVGLGYYLRSSDGRGYVVQAFGRDSAFAPLIVEYEAVNTTSQDVHLYLYGQEGSGSFAEQGAVTEMMISNDICFTNSAWQSYTDEQLWRLQAGTGWKTVYARTRDAVGRTRTVDDTIYLGANIPLDDLGLHLASTTTDQVTVPFIDCQGLPYVQLSPHWFTDDTFDTFTHWWGNGERVVDPTARGGTAFRLRPGDGESFAWVWTVDFVKDTPLVAYFRLKIDDNTSPTDVARISVKGGGTEYGPLHLAGTDFEAANVYQEFAIPFTFHTDPDDDFLLFNFWRSGSADLDVDGVYIFTASQAVQSPLTWQVPGSNYRGNGIWMRCTDGAGTFSPLTEVSLNVARISVSPSRLVFLAEDGQPPPPPRTLSIGRGGCNSFTWDVSDDAPWLDLQRLGDTVEVSVGTSGLAPGDYKATITVEAEDGVAGSPAQVPVTLIIGPIRRNYLPIVPRNS